LDLLESNGEGRMTKKMPPMHPGEVLREEFLGPLGLTPYALAQVLDIPRTRIERIAREETAITADTAHRLGRYFSTTPQFWLNLQTEYDLRLAAAGLGKALEKIEPMEMTAHNDDPTPRRRRA
jgi:antitoxin HigA-1